MNTEDIDYNIEQLELFYDHFMKDVQSFISKGNKSAAVRARKALLEINKLGKDIRKQIQEIKNANTSE